MKHSFYSILLAMACSLLGMNVQAQNLSTTVIDGKEYYEIGSGSELAEFAGLVNGSETVLNAVLTDDIDLTDLTAFDGWTPIGDWSTGSTTSAFRGHFDGQGHTITGFNVTATQNNFGLFGVVAEGALVENFTVYGTLTTNNNNNFGAIGFARDDNTTIRGIHSCLTINNTANGKRVGGILGASDSGHVTIDCCTYSGTLDGKDTGGNGNYGGILGYIANNASSFITISNCLFDGKLTNTAEPQGNCTLGGIVGYTGANPSVTIKNCLSIGTVSSAVYGQFFGAVKSGTSSIENSYYKGKVINGSESTVNITDGATLVTDAQLASGEIAFALGSTNWFQTLIDDAYPFPYSDNGSHGTIYANGRQHCDGTPYEGVTYSNEDSGTIIDSHDFVDGFCSYCREFDGDYMTPNTDGFYEIANAKQLVWFAAKVNNGSPNANAILTADIDMEGADISKFPIGYGGDNSNTRYVGTFDGQGHKLSNFQLVNSEAPESYGMFNTLTGVTLKNFWLDSTCAIQGTQVVGLIGRHSGGGTFEGIGNCADVTGTQNNVGGLFGGVFGNGNDKKNVSIKNCWTTGKVTTTNPSAGNGKDCGALTGWFNNAIVTIEGFWTISEVVNPRSQEAYVYRNGNGASFTITNSFSMNGSQPNYPNFTEEKLGNGWLAYNLGTDWSQYIGTDATPVLSTDNPVSYIGEAGYATLYDTTTGYKLNGDAQAYAAVNNGTWLSLTKIPNIPAGTPVILKGSYYNKTAAELPDINVANDLKGTDVATEADGSMYVLAVKDDVVAFYKAEGTIPAGKAYYQSASGVKAFYFEGDDATGIADIQSPETNGQPIYNLAGQRIQKMQHGINIIGGKKVLY